MSDIELTTLGNFGTDNKVIGVESGTLVWKDFNLDDYIESSEKGINDGVASLDGSGKVPLSQLPPLGNSSIKSLLSDYSGDFSAAMTDIGATNTTLLIDTDVTITSTTSIPETTYITFENNAKITVNSGQTLTVNSMINPGNKQIFGGAGTIRLMPLAIEYFNLTWWAGTNTSKNITTELNAILENCATNNGGVIFIPHGVWKTDGGHILPTNTTIQGVGKHGDSTRCSILELEDLASSIYIMKVSESFRDVSIRNIGFSTSTSVLSNNFIIEGTAPNSASGLYFDNVSFHGLGTNSPPQVYLKDLGSDWELMALTFNHCQWIVPPSTRGFMCDTINTAIKFDQAFFYFAAGATATYIEHAANVLYANCTFNGISSIPNVETEDRVINGSIDTGTKDLSLDSGSFTQNDIGQKVTIAGKLDSYITGIDSTTTATVEDNATATASNESLSVYRSTPSPSNAKVAIHIGGSHGTITIIGCQDEGLQYFLINDGSQQQYPVSIISSNIQSIIQLNQSMTLLSTGNSYFSQTFEETAGDSLITSVGDYFDKTTIHYNSSGYGVELLEPRPWGIKNGAGAFLLNTSSREGYSNLHDVEVPTNFSHKYSIYSANPKLSEAVININTAFDKPQLRIGRIDQVLDQMDYYYDIKRDYNTGRLFITGNQAEFAGLDYNGRLVKRTKTVLTSSATIDLNSSLSDRFTLVPAHNATINASNGVDGQTISIEIVTSGTTSYNIAFGTNFLSTGDLTTGVADGATFKLMFEHNGTNFVELSRTTAMV